MLPVLEFSNHLQQMELMEQHMIHNSLDKHLYWWKIVHNPESQFFYYDLIEVEIIWWNVSLLAKMKPINSIKNLIKNNKILNSPTLWRVVIHKTLSVNWYTKLKQKTHQLYDIQGVAIPYLSKPLMLCKLKEPEFETMPSLNSYDLFLGFFL